MERDIGKVSRYIGEMKRPPFIGHYKEFQEPDNSCYKGSDELLSIGSPVGKKLGELHPGDFVAFPSGTGIAHTFLNNTETPCLLLVGGEANKPDAKIYYPLHPERNEQCRAKGMLWEDAPKRKLGPHDGKPNILKKGQPE